MRFGGDVIEILLLLCCGQFTNIPDKQVFLIVTAESAGKGGRGWLTTGLYEPEVHTSRCLRSSRCSELNRTMKILTFTGMGFPECKNVKMRLSSNGFHCRLSRRKMKYCSRWQKYRRYSSDVLQKSTPRDRILFLATILDMPI